MSQNQCVRSTGNRSASRVRSAVRAILLGSTSGVFATALVAGPATAQDKASPAAEALEAIVVTGTRIKRDGYAAPSPLTVVSAEEVTAAAPGTLSDGLNQLPQFLGSSTPQQGGVSANGGVGSNFLSLRNLGSQRVLVLLDGRRFVPSADSGATDINTLPQNLVERIETVTGGASAAYGSDAVTGVVNFVLDKDYTGLKFNAQTGTSGHKDADSDKVSVAWGRGFADERLHVLFSGEYYRSEGIGPYDANRAWNVRGSGRIGNTTGAGPGTLILEDGVTVSAATFGGLINAGPLSGTQFGPGGTPQPFNFGSYRSSTFMVGGDGIRNDRNLTTGLERYNLFARADYDVSDSLNLFVEGSFANSTSNWEQYYNYCYTSCAATIFRTNAYLPAATLQRMIATNTQSFRLNRIHAENYILAENDKDVWRGAVGLQGSMDNGWTYDAYVGSGRSDSYTANLQVLHYRRYFAAIDAVVDPATGKIVCRSTLSGYDPGCVPFNPFGQGSPSPEAMKYVTPDEWRRLVTDQDVAAASLQGDLFSIGDRKAAFATGIEWRRESSDQTVSPIAQEVVDFTGIRGGPASLAGQVGPFIVGNPQPLAGSVSVKEVFAELALPLLHDRPGAQALDVDLAARYTDYSLSGGVTTWKASVNYAPVTDVRLRATRSRDIRAPNVAELFTGARQGIGTAILPSTGQTVDVVTKSRGNPGLDPETADTLTAGIVYQPSVLPGFSISLDHYDIDIDGAIGTLGRQELFDQCAAGVKVACGSIELVGTQYRLDLPFLNLDNLRVKGWDLESSYARGLGPGVLAARLLVNHQTDNTRTTSGGVVTKSAGEVGLSDNPEWRGVLSLNYSIGAFSFRVQERYIHSGGYDLTKVEGVSINENDVDAIWYTDATGTWEFGGDKQYQAYLTVNNLFDADPPFSPQVSGTHLSWANFSLYDTIGRYFNLGFRAKF